MADSPGQGSDPITSRYASDPEMSDLVGWFVGELPARVSSLRAAWEAQRLKDLERLVHQLRGAGMGYGFPAISEAAGSLERRLVDLAGRPAPEAAALAGEFERLVDVCARACAPGR
jgi:HPt (histidine-containing phosphotransfer) domain-containing protein